MECQHFFQNLEIGSLFQIYKKDQIFLNLNKLWVLLKNKIWEKNM